MRSPAAFFQRLTLIPQGITIVIAAFLPIFAIVSMFPALPAIIGRFADNPNARELVPLMVSAPGLAIAIVAPFAGYFVDRFGRLPLLIWATFFYGVFGVAPFFLDSLTLIFATRILLGVCEAAILTIVNTLIGDYWDDEGRRDWLFLQGIAGPFLASGVIYIAGTVTELRWNGIFLVYSMAFVIFLAMKFFLFEPKPDDLKSARASASNVRPTPGQGAMPFPMKAVLLVGVLTLFTSALYYVFIISGSLAFREIGVTEPSRIGRLTALPSLFIIVGAFIFRMLGNKANAVQLGAFLLVLGSGLLGIGIAVSVPMMVAAIVIQQTGAGMTVPSLIAWTQTKLPFEHRGRGMGIWTACFFFGQFTSPWLVARVEQLTGSVQDAFAAAGIAAVVVASALFIAASRQKSRKPAPQPGA